MSVHEFEGQVYYLGNDRLRERLTETQSLIRSLDNEENEMLARLKVIRGTRSFLKRDYRKIWNRLVASERLKK